MLEVELRPVDPAYDDHRHTLQLLTQACVEAGTIERLRVAVAPATERDLALVRAAPLLIDLVAPGTLASPRPLRRTFQSGLDEP